MKGQVTPARRRALEVLGVRNWARVGVGMYDCDPAVDPIVTPAGESWLVDMGYAVRSGDRLAITATGVYARAALPDEIEAP